MLPSPGQEPLIISSVYALKEGNHYSSNPIVIRPNIDERAKKIFWENTAKGMGLSYNNLEFVEGDFMVTTHDHRVYKFTYLTKEVFNSIKGKIVTKEGGFDTTEAIQQYFLDTCFF